MKTDKCFVMRATTGLPVRTRDGKRYLVLDLNNTPNRVLNQWFKRGFYFAPSFWCVSPVYGSMTVRAS